MANTIIALDSFSAPPHASHILPEKDGDNIIIHLLDKYYNNQGNIILSRNNAKIFAKELLEELYGQMQLPE